MGQEDSILRPGEIAARARYFMARAGFDGRGGQARFAKVCGVTPGTMSEWLSAGSFPTHENLARICKECGVTLAEFWDAPVVVLPAQVEG